MFACNLEVDTPWYREGGYFFWLLDGTTLQHQVVPSKKELKSVKRKSFEIMYIYKTLWEGNIIYAPEGEIKGLSQFLFFLFKNSLKQKDKHSLNTCAII